MHGDLLPVHLKEEELRQSNAYCKERSTASRMKHFSVLLITLLATSTVANEYYDHAVWVDLRKSYQLSWRLNRSREIFVFKVDVKAVGWVGLGISNGHGRGLSNADLWLGWMDNDGKPFLKVFFISLSLLSRKSLFANQRFLRENFVEEIINFGAPCISAVFLL